MARPLPKVKTKRYLDLLDAVPMITKSISAQRGTGNTLRRCICYDRRIVIVLFILT